MAEKPLTHTHTHTHTHIHTHTHTQTHTPVSSSKPTTLSQECQTYPDSERTIERICSLGGLRVSPCRWARDTYCPQSTRICASICLCRLCRTGSPAGLNQHAISRARLFRCLRACPGPYNGPEAAKGRRAGADSPPTNRHWRERWLVYHAIS